MKTSDGNAFTVPHLIEKCYIGLPNLEDDARRALELADLLAQQSLLVW